MEAYRFGHEAMTSTFEVVIAGQDQKYSRQAAETAFREIDRLELMLNRFEPTSDVGQINILKPGESMKISAEVMECLLIALWVNVETNGAYDVTVGLVMDYLRKGKREEEGIDPREAEAAFKETFSKQGMKRLIIKPEEFEVSLPDDGLGSAGLDLGGIGKGFALDKAMESIADWGVDNALMHGSSTVLAIGDGPGDDEAQNGWPAKAGGKWETHRVMLNNEALSGSGKAVKGAHVLDPRSGASAAGHEATWVVSPSAAVSDALSTAFMVMGTDEVKQFCSSHDGIDAYVVKDDKLLHV